jgi:hypothetical protein
MVGFYDMLLENKSTFDWKITSFNDSDENLEDNSLSIWRFVFKSLSFQANQGSVQLFTTLQESPCCHGQKFK